MHRRSFQRRPVAAAVFLGATIVAFAPARAEARTEPAPGVVQNLGRYCTTCWRNARVPVDLWADCTQDVFHRLLERVPAGSWPSVFAGETEERREFLRAIDMVKKRMRRARKASGSVEAVVDPREAQQRGLAEEREAVRQAAGSVLSARQQQIVQRSFEGWSVNEIAADLEVPAARVSDEKYKAIHKLRTALCEAEKRS
jgi:RNA polymerase sigma factor (sigma-70 family)